MAVVERVGTTSAVAGSRGAGAVGVLSRRVGVIVLLLASVLVVGAALADARELASPCPTTAAAPPFDDVDGYHTHGSAVSCLVALEITQGITPTTFGYTRSLQHGQLAAFVARSLDATDAVYLPWPIGPWFTGESTHRLAIDRLYEVGIIEDLEDYEPSATVTRGEMAEVVAASLVFAGVLPREADTTVFSDVAGHHAADAIHRLGVAGVVHGDGEGRFRPNATLTRGQMATFVTSMLAFIDNGGQTLPPPGPAPQRPDPVPPPRTAPEGWLIAGGSSPVAGTGGGTVRYTVEIANGLERRQPLADFAARVDAVLGDPDHGWTSRGARRVQRVDDPSQARIRIVLGTPAQIDRLCARAGLNTAGIYSCWNGRFAALNSDRWFTGVRHIDDLELYRDYLINHEVGHGFGFGHVSCPGPGRLAPVMVQQSMANRLGSCRPNGLPYP